MGMERVKHTEILAYAELNEFCVEEQCHLYRVMIAMDDVLVDFHAEKDSG